MMTRKIILICAIVVGVVLAALVLNFYYGLRKMYRYEFYYNKNALVFEGAPVKKQMEYDKVIVNFGEDNPEKTTSVQIHDQKYRWGDISCEVLMLIGAKRDEYSSYGRVFVDYTIYPPDGFCPPYMLNFRYVNDKLISYLYSIQNPPDPSMEPPQKVPVTLLFQDGFQITLPVKQSVIEKRFGKPDKVRKFIVFP